MPQFHTLRSYRNNGGGVPNNQRVAVPGTLASSVIVEKEKHTDALVRQDTQKQQRQQATAQRPGGPRGSLLLRPGAVKPKVTRDLRNPVSEVPVKDPSTTSLQIEQVNRGLQVIDQQRSLQVIPPQSRYISLSVSLHNVQPFVNGMYAQRAGVRGKTALVIPGKQKRSHETEELYVRQSRHLSVHQRHAAMVITTVCIFFFCMLTLTPIGPTTQSTFVQRLVQSPVSWNVAGRSGGQAGATALTLHGPVGSEAYYRALADADALKYGISPYYYERQIQQESHFDPNAVSPTGALGIAQFEPETARELGFDPTDPVQALDGGARFMAQLNNEFNGDYRKALAAYNAGPGAVDNAVAACGAAWLSCMDGQPQAYVYIIMGY